MGLQASLIPSSKVPLPPLRAQTSIRFGWVVIVAANVSYWQVRFSLLYNADVPKVLNGCVCHTPAADSDFSEPLPGETLVAGPKRLDIG